VTTRPNILLIMTDQQRADSLNGAPLGPSDLPNLRTLAARGVHFDNAYSGATVCVPARSSLLTGLLPHRLPVAGNQLALREGHFTIAHALARAGYETALFGKMHFWPMRADHGFRTMRLCEHLDAGYDPDEVDDYGAWLDSTGRTDERQRHGPKVFAHPAEFHPTSWVTRETIAFLERPRGDKPYFVVVSYPHPHSPYDPPEPFASAFDPELEPMPNDGIEVNADLPEEFRSAIFDQPRGAYPQLRVTDFSPSHVRAVLAAIRALLAQIDDAIGQLMDHVDLGNTVVFFTSDHGDYGGHRGLLGKVPWIPFDDLAKVPFFCLGAGIAGGRRVSAPVQSSDFALTALDLAGVVPPAAGFDTRSLLALLRGGAERPERPVFCATSQGWPMMRRSGIKHIWHQRSDQHLLYDLEADPGEIKNIALYPESAFLLAESVEFLKSELARPMSSLRSDSP
jgi:arylsulfatase